MITLIALLLLQASLAVQAAPPGKSGIEAAVGTQERPPPLPLPACLDGYLVLFEWASDDLSPQAQAVLDNAASTYRICPRARLLLSGHTDRSGSDRFNVGLSRRRAANVRAYLAGRGVPDGAMTVEALGESRPRVDTADGDRELQNRRVEVLFNPTPEGE